jgi:glycosyltransferase involved in cell wall biosynthesis
MIHHGVDHEKFYPISHNSWQKIELGDGTEKVLTTRAAAAEFYGFKPDQKIILRTDRAVERKQYDVFFATMNLVCAERDDIDFVVHCKPNDEVNLFDESTRLTREAMSHLRFTNGHDTFNGLPTEAMNAMYNMASLYFSPTGGEGFGLTLLESIACKTPVVTTDAAAGPEVVGPGGRFVPPLRYADGTPVRLHSKYGMDWVQSDPVGSAEAILQLFEHPTRLMGLYSAGHAHARKFTWDACATQFVDLFTHAVDVRANLGSNGDHTDSSGSQVLSEHQRERDDARRATEPVDPERSGEAGEGVGEDAVGVE